MLSYVALQQQHILIFSVLGCMLLVRQQKVYTFVSFC